MSTTIYYRNRVEVIDISRCERYWELRSRAIGKRSKHLPAMRRQDALDSLQAHIEVCDQCRRWYEVTEAAGGQTPEIIETEEELVHA